MGGLLWRTGCDASKQFAHLPVHRIQGSGPGAVSQLSAFNVRALIAALPQVRPRPRPGCAVVRVRVHCGAHVCAPVTKLMWRVCEWRLWQ